MSTTFLTVIKLVPDSRVPGMITYPLSEVLFSVFAGFLCGGEDFDDFVDIGEELLDWYAKFMPFANGIAPAQTMRRLLRVVDPKPLEAALSIWIRPLRERAEEIVAIDGKSLRGSKRKITGSDALHLIEAYACETGLVIGQCPARQKAIESQAIPDLVNLLDLKGAIVTADAAATFPKTAAAIARRGADYVLALKSNQQALYPDVTNYFADPALKAQCAVHRQTTSGHGRIETRTLSLATDIAWLTEAHPQWPKLKTIAAIVTEREDKKSGKTSTDTRYFISSLDAGPQRLMEIIQSHWAIENGLHWILDVAFNEDHCRIRTGHAARNLGLFRRAVFNILRQDKSPVSFKRKRLKAMMNSTYRAQLLAR